MPRAGLGYSNGVSVPSGSAAELGNVTISVPGVPGNTQFVMIVAQVDTQIQSMAGCPCLTSYGIWLDSANGGAPVVDRRDRGPVLLRRLDYITHV